MNLLFIRHGETDWNVEGRLQGQRDIDLNARGRRQALDAGHRAAAVLESQNRQAADARFVASPLRRACDTMAGVRSVLGLPAEGYELDERLREFSFGAWEGLLWAEVKRRDPLGYAARRRDKWGFVPPAGESYAMLATRVGAWLATLDDPAVVVSHGGVARVLMVLIGGLTTEQAPQTEVPQGRVIHFKDRGFVVR